MKVDLDRLLLRQAEVGNTSLVTLLLMAGASPRPSLDKVIDPSMNSPFALAGHKVKLHNLNCALWIFTYTDGSVPYIDRAVNLIRIIKDSGLRIS